MRAIVVRQARATLLAVGSPAGQGIRWDARGKVVNWARAQRRWTDIAEHRRQWRWRSLEHETLNGQPNVKDADTLEKQGQEFLKEFVERNRQQEEAKVRTRRWAFIRITFTACLRRELRFSRIVW